MRRTVGLLAVLALVTSGCFASGSIESFVAAQKHRGVADAAAQEWDDPARLVAVRGLESNQTDDDYPFLMDRPDPLVGDGRAQAWQYVYASDARADQHYRVTVAANGTVVDANVTARDDEMVAVVDWNVDSDEAAHTAHEANATYRNATGRDDTTVASFLTMVETEDNKTDPHWLLLVEEDNGSDLLFLAVNARNGTYMGAFSTTGLAVPFHPRVVPEESGTFQGEVTVADPQNTHTFQLRENGHESLQVELRIAATGPESVVNMTVEGPNGTTGATTWSGGSGSSGETAVVFGQPARGAWSVTVRLDSGLAQDYEVGWCAPGIFLSPPDPAAPRGC